MFMWASTILREQLFRCHCNYIPIDPNICVEILGQNIKDIIRLLIIQVRSDALNILDIPFNNQCFGFFVIKSHLKPLSEFRNFSLEPYTRLTHYRG